MKLNTFERAIAYTLKAVAIENTFTALKDFPRFQGHTQLWVYPLYGLGSVFVFEPLHEAIRDRNCLVRATAYAIMFLSLEYFGGFVAKKITGKCPWEYTNYGHIHGFINPLYAPFWALFGFAAEKAHNYYLSINRSSLT